MNQKSYPLQQLREEVLTKLASTTETDNALNKDELLHELRVHQIELEMQNQELQQAHTALEISRDRYLELYDFAPVAYLTLSEEGLITEANLTASTLLGVVRKKLINKRFASYVAPEDGDLWHHHFLQLKRQSSKAPLQLSLRHANGRSIFIQIDCMPQKVVCVPWKLRITLTDISARKQAEEQLRIAAVAFEAHEGIIVTDELQHILRANKAFTQITGYSFKEIIGQNPSFLQSGLHDADFYLAMWTAVEQEGHWQGEIMDRRKNGAIFPLWLTLTKVTDAQGKISHYVGTFTDITALKLAEKILLEARLQLENQVVSTQEELEKIQHESEDITTALKVLLKHQKNETTDAQLQLSQQINGTVLPFLDKLKNATTDVHQNHLLAIVETNLLHLMKTYGRNDNLNSVYARLTPVEILVASLVRQGLSTKLIATSLHLSTETIHIHRKHLRKKLGLNDKANNLTSYLLSLDE